MVPNPTDTTPLGIPGPDGPVTYRHLAAVLDAVEARAEGVDLAPIVQWALKRSNFMHGDSPTVAGQVDGGVPADRIRDAVGRWAAHLGGEVVEIPEAAYTVVEARARVAGVLVVVWDHVYGPAPAGGEA